MMTFRKTAAVAIAAWVMLGLAGISPAATFTVNTTQPEGEGSLAWAVGQANQTAGPDAIVFALDGSQRIALNQTLLVSDPVMIDGGKSAVVGLNPEAGSVMILNFLAGSGGSVVKDLALVNGYAGCFLQSENNRVVGCAIGTDWSDTAGLGNVVGVLVTGADNVIGGPAAGDRNVISGNSEYGVLADNAWNCRIQGNFIGTDSSGRSAMGNRLGVMLQGTTMHSLVGGTHGPVGVLAEGNLISGNLWAAQIDGFAATGNTVCGNIMGLTLDQSAVLASDDGMTVRATAGNWVGLPEPGKDNVICGHRISGIANDGPVPARHNVIQNNFIGVTEAGAIFPNAIGIILYGDENLVGGLSGLERNVILRNTDMGLEIIGSGNTVRGNLIGGSRNAVVVNGSTSIRNGLFGNTITAFREHGILLSVGANENQPAPLILAADAGMIRGSSRPGDAIEVFKAEPRPNRYGGSLRSVGTVLADTDGNWSLVPNGLEQGDYACALATDANRNTSAFSQNARVVTASEPTATATVTANATPEITPGIATATPERRASLELRMLRIAPNPARDRVAFMLELDQGGEVTVAVYNLAGERVALLRAEHTSGSQNLAWDTREVAAGIYIVRVLRGGEEIGKGKVAIVR